MFRFEITSFDEFKGTLDLGKQVIVSVYKDKSPIPTIVSYIVYINHNNESVLGMIKFEGQEENVDARTFNRCALEGKVIDGLLFYKIDPDRIIELYKLLVSEGAYLFTTTDFEQ